MGSNFMYATTFLGSLVSRRPILYFMNPYAFTLSHCRVMSQDPSSRSRYPPLRGIRSRSSQESVLEARTLPTELPGKGCMQLLCIIVFFLSLQISFQNCKNLLEVDRHFLQLPQRRPDWEELVPWHCPVVRGGVKGAPPPDGRKAPAGTGVVLVRLQKKMK